MRDLGMQDLVVYGAGGLGRELRGLVRAVDLNGQKWRFAGFVDDNAAKGTCVGDATVLGDMEYLSGVAVPTAVVLGLASTSAKARIYKELIKNPHISFPVLVHPLAYVEPSAVLSPGVVISPFCFVAVDAFLGTCVFLNAAAQVGHDSRVGDFCSVMPSCNISGNVTIGARTLIGVGSGILQGISVGADATVGIGSVVLNDVPDGCTVMGYPARVVKKKEE